MKFLKVLVTLLASLAMLFTFSFDTFATDPKPNKKRGQVYFKMVCTTCHKDTAGHTIPPSDQTMQQWREYFDAGVHDTSGKTNSVLQYYVSKKYRDSIKEKNKAAKKFINLSSEQLFADVREFAVTGAKDSDTPASCN